MNNTCILCPQFFESKHFEKGMIYMKILKKGGSREKGGGGNEIHAPFACAQYKLQKKLLVRPFASKRRPVPYRSPLVSNIQ